MDATGAAGYPWRHYVMCDVWLQEQILAQRGPEPDSGNGVIMTLVPTAGCSRNKGREHPGNATNPRAAARQRAPAAHRLDDRTGPERVGDDGQGDGYRSGPV